MLLDGSDPSSAEPCLHINHGSTSMVDERGSVRNCRDMSGLESRFICSWLEFMPGCTQEHQDTWMHRSPLVEKGSVLVAKPGFWSLDCPCFHKVGS